MVRSTLRVGKGGPRGNIPFTGMRGSSNNSIQMQFRLDWDERDLVQALDRLGYDGDKIMKNTLRGVIEMAITDTRKQLKKMAGPLYNIKVPNKPSKSIHTTIGDALTQDDIPGSSFIRVHTASDPSHADKGIKGSRGLNISKMLVQGIKPFKYSRFLPQVVQSSAGWYKFSGNARDNSRAMRKTGTHPGFTRTFDYILYIETFVRKDFPKWSKQVAEAAGLKAGFGVE